MPFDIILTSQAAPNRIQFEAAWLVTDMPLDPTWVFSFSQRVTSILSCVSISV